MKLRWILLLPLFSAAAIAAPPKPAPGPQIQMPAYYQGPRQITGCNAATLSQRLAQACNIRYGQKSGIRWVTHDLSRAVCSGVAEAVGQGVVYTIMGNVKPCPGPAAIPAVQGWMCDTTIDKNFNVIATDVYYSSCMG